MGTAPGERLRQFMAEEGLRLADVGAILGVSAAHVCHITRGSRRPSLDLALRIEEATRRWKPRGPVGAWEWARQRAEVAG